MLYNGSFAGLVIVIIGTVVYFIIKIRNKNKQEKINSWILKLKNEYLFKTSLNNQEIIYIKNYLNKTNYYHKVQEEISLGPYTQVIIRNEDLLYLKNYLENIDDFTYVLRDYE